MIIIILGVGLALSLFAAGFCWISLESAKTQLESLKKLNSKLSIEVDEYKAKNSNLWSDYNEAIQKLEKQLIAPETKVSWVDKNGDIETGFVLDDYQLKNKNYVVIIRMKDNKTQGAPISIPFEKLIFS
jgi:TPP-dependent trihydroxycyclohexane-1,2-dione (THcHDO) dehydratase